MFISIARFPLRFFLAVMVAGTVLALLAIGHDPATSLAANGFGWVAHTQ